MKLHTAYCGDNVLSEPMPSAVCTADGSCCCKEEPFDDRPDCIGKASIPLTSIGAFELTEFDAGFRMFLFSVIDRGGGVVKRRIKTKIIPAKTSKAVFREIVICSTICLVEPEEATETTGCFLCATDFLLRKLFFLISLLFPKKSVL